MDPRKPQLPDHLSGPIEDLVLTDHARIERCRIVTADAGFGVAAGVKLDQVWLERVVLQRSELPNSQFLDASFDLCDLANLSLTEAEVIRTEFKACRMTGFFAGEASLRDVSFVDCRLDLANFRHAKLRSVLFSQCDLRGCDFNGAEIESARFEKCQLSGASFARASLDKVDLRTSPLAELASAEGLSGAIVDPVQVIDLGPLMARALGLEIRED